MSPRLEEREKTTQGVRERERKKKRETEMGSVSMGMKESRDSDWLKRRVFLFGKKVRDSGMDHTSHFTSSEGTHPIPH
jgi:hypothetical protein